MGRQAAAIPSLDRRDALTPPAPSSAFAILHRPYEHHIGNVEASRRQQPQGHALRFHGLASAAQRFIDRPAHLAVAGRVAHWQGCSA